MDIDFSKLAQESFYAGAPTKVSPDSLVWDTYDCTLSVRLWNGVPVATMESGNCEWTTPLDPREIVKSIDAALEDACLLADVARATNDE